MVSRKKKQNEAVLDAVVRKSVNDLARNAKQPVAVRRGDIADLASHSPERYGMFLDAWRELSKRGRWSGVR